jgi:hypothetical protein
MNPVRLGFQLLFIALVLFAWAWFFRKNLRRWWYERGPRKQLAREAAQEREAELTRLRDELAAKYLGDGAAKPPGPGT